MVLDCLQVVVEFFEVVVGGFRWLLMVLGGFRSFHVLVTTPMPHVTCMAHWLAVCQDPSVNSHHVQCLTITFFGSSLSLSAGHVGTGNLCNTGQNK